MFLFGGARMENITPADLQKRVENKEKLTIVDVREPWEYQEGHLPGSRLLPLGQIRTWAGELPKNEEIIVYCRTAARSASAYKYLQAQGFTKVKNMSGGIIAWRGAVQR